MASGSAIAEMPAPSIFTRFGVDSQVLAQHVATANDITGFEGCVHIGAALVTMGAGLQRNRRVDVGYYLMRYRQIN